MYSAQGVIVPPTGSFEVGFGVGRWLLGSLAWQVLGDPRCQLAPSFLVELEKRQVQFVVFGRRRTVIVARIDHPVAVAGKQSLVAERQIDLFEMNQVGHIGSAEAQDGP